MPPPAPPWPRPAPAGLSGDKLISALVGAAEAGLAAGIAGGKGRAKKTDKAAAAAKLAYGPLAFRLAQGRLSV